jgi:23S rRNA (adenine2503-C2)-methyltransferase
LSLSLDELAEALGGRGRAVACWECFRLGVDPLWFYDTEGKSETTEATGGWTNSEGWTREQLQSNITNHNTNGLGQKSLQLLRDQFGGDASNTMEDRIATLSQISTSSDGTTKLLLQLQTEDAYEIETVIIPWPDRHSSTLCISSQVGCRQACTFCATGRMGKLRNLSSDEILVQVYWAVKLCRLLTDMPPIDNIVFMGMGEPADNAEAVVTVAHRLVDLFQLAPRRITISTVAPSPKAFYDLAKGKVVLAWSLHASRDAVRQALVPTTQHSMVEMRTALLDTLRSRSKRLRSCMLEVTLLHQLNDSVADALHLVEFCQPFRLEHIKLVVNLIPWNDIGAEVGPAAQYRPPHPHQVLAFQTVLVDHGILCYVRTTRGQEEHAACGMLATTKRRTQ